MQMNDYRDEKPIELAPVIPNTHTGLVDWIRRELKCPLPVENGEKYYSLRDKLIVLWKKVVRENSVDDEWIHIYHDAEEFEFQVNEDSVYELDKIVRNAIPRIGQMQEEFLNLTAVLQMRIAEKDDYAKHFPRKKSISKKDIIALAKKLKTSFLFPEIDLDDLEKIFLDSAYKLLEPLVSKNDIRYSVVCDKDVGVTDKGVVTRCLFFDISWSGKIIHAYPCSDDEAINNVKTYETKFGCLLDFEWEEYDKYKNYNRTDIVCIPLSTAFNFTD